MSITDYATDRLPMLLRAALIRAHLAGDNLPWRDKAEFDAGMGKALEAASELSGRMVEAVRAAELSLESKPEPRPAPVPQPAAPGVNTPKAINAEIRRLAGEGHGPKAIAAELSARGAVTRRGNPISAPYVSDVLWKAKKD